MTYPRAFTVATMHARDLSRRRLALAILILLPLVFYFAAELQPASPEVEQLLEESSDQRASAELWIVATGAIGAGWAIAVAALFVMIGSRRADQPLLLAGYRPADLLAGRVVTVLGLAALITPLFSVVIWTQREIDLGLLILSMALSSLVAAAIGVLTAALVPREMEGVLVIIGVIGVQMSGDPQRWMPLWGSGELLQRANGIPDVASAPSAIAHSLLFTTALLAAGIGAWVRRSRLQPPAEQPSAAAPAPVSQHGAAR